MARYQGNFGTIIDGVMRKLRLDAVEDVDDVKAWINLAYLDVVQRTECLQRTSLAAMTTNVDSYVLPPGVLIIKKLDVVYADNTISRPMTEVTLETLLNIRHTDSQVPQMVYDPLYALMGQDQIEVWPVPGAGQSLRFWYVYAPEQLVNNSDEPLIKEPFGSNLLELEACGEAARFKKDILIMGDLDQQTEYWYDRYTTFLNRSNTINQFPINERTGSQIPHDPSSDYAFNWR